jgi:hypothetical protein
MEDRGGEGGMSLRKVAREFLDNTFSSYELVKVDERGEEGGYIVLRGSLFSYLDLREAEKIAHRYSFQLFFSVSPDSESSVRVNLMLKRKNTPQP